MGFSNVYVGLLYSGLETLLKIHCSYEVIIKPIIILVLISLRRQGLTPMTSGGRWFPPALLGPGEPCTVITGDRASRII